MYLYELPTTGAISFSDLCVDQTSSRRHITHLPAATEARANLRAVLKDSKRTDHDQKDFLRSVKHLEEYIPQLRSIIDCVAHDEISLKSEPSFSWRTTIAANIFSSSPRLSIPGLYTDLVFTLLSYAFALSNLGRSTALSLGQYEHDRAITEADRKAKDSQLNVAVDFLCRASGICTYVGDTVLPEWDGNLKGDPTAFEKPPELNREVSTALAKMALADAQSLAIRSLLSRAAYDSNIAPGPPLPRSHPSPALIAKLHLECSSLYTSALSLIKANGASQSKSEVSADLRRYLTEEGAFHAALARKWLGVDAGERGGKERGGDAVGFMMWAKKALEALKDGGKGIDISRGDKKEMRNRLKERITDQLESVKVFLKYYKKANETIHFQQVPIQSDLQARIPAGMTAVSAKPYKPPAPAFGPGSVARLEAEAASSGELDTGGAAGIDTSPANLGTYAGAGSYF